MTDRENEERCAHEILENWPSISAVDIKVVEGGLINRTFCVDNGRSKYALQRLHPVFAPELHFDIEAVTRHLISKGMPTPQLVRTSKEELCVMSDDGCWRVMSWIDGTTVHQFQSLKMTEEAGALVGRFHLALEDLQHDHRFSRPGAHDTKKHMQTLESAISQYRSHALYDDVARVSEKLIMESERLHDLFSLPHHHSHGDLKVSNMIFDDRDRALCLIDLDTLAKLPRAIELGDAFRSWCNPHREDAYDAVFEEELFAAGLAGYASVAGMLWTSEEVEGLLEGVKTLPLELASRYLADALAEVYWGWDSLRFRTRGEHNLRRGLGQWQLFCDVKKKEAKLARQIQSAFRRA